MEKDQEPTFFPRHRPVPAGLRTGSFLLEPLTPAHTALDYAALLESREQLRRWSGSSWPAADFTLEANRADLAWHDDEHRRRIAFTYTVLAPDRRRCLGCVYIKPLAPLLAAQPDPTRLPAADPPAAAVRWWVTTPLLATDGDRQLLAALRSWFDEAWGWRQLVFHAPAGLIRQTTAYAAAGLRWQFDLFFADRGGWHSCWG